MIEGMLISPIVGAIGGLASQWFARDAKKLDVEDRKNEREHTRLMAEITHRQALEMTRIEAEAAARQAVIEGDIKITTADLSNLNAAILSMPKWSGIQPEDSAPMKWFKTIIEATATLTRVVITIGAAGSTGDEVRIVNLILSSASMRTAMVFSFDGLPRAGG